MKALFISVVLVAVAVSAAGAQDVRAPSTLAPATQTPATQAATATPMARPTPGPVLVGGKSTFIVVFDSGNTKTVIPTQANAPPGVSYVATPGTMCIGAVNVTTTGTILPGGPITSKGPFTFTRVGSPIGCAVSISSSAGGAPATVVFQ
jgi:hypothetical protein